MNCFWYWPVGIAAQVFGPIAGSVGELFEIRPCGPPDQSSGHGTAQGWIMKPALAALFASRSWQGLSLRLGAGILGTWRDRGVTRGELLNLIGKRPGLILRLCDALLDLGESRFDERLGSRCHLGLDLRRDRNSVGAGLGCHGPIWAETAMQINAHFQASTRERLQCNVADPVDCGRWCDATLRNACLE